MPLPLGGEHGLPYSRGLMARALMAVGVVPDRAYMLARRVGDDLSERRSDVVELERLGSLAVEILGEVEGTEAVRQLRRYQELRELDLPIVILVGGATGTGGTKATGGRKLSTLKKIKMRNVPRTNSGRAFSTNETYETV